MYGWIDLADVIQEDQIEALSNIGQMLKSQDRESQKLAIDLLLMPEFDNIRKASVDCGPMIIRYNIMTKSYTVKKNYNLSHHQIYTIGYVVNTIKDFPDHVNLPDYYWSAYDFKSDLIRDLISCLTLTINRTIELGQSFI